MELPENYIIHDIRTSSDFKGITISGYKRKDVINAFQTTIINSKLEDAIRWCVELHSTGLNKIIMDTLKNTYFRYIHINNPKFLLYLLKREESYKRCVDKYPKKHEIFSRNDQELRNLYAELTAIATLTKKNNIFINKSLPTINQRSFEKEELAKRIISKNLDPINEYIFNDTSKEIKLALNEIYTNLLSSKYGTFQTCIYWYLGIEKMDKNIQKEIPMKYNSEFSNHWAFIIWDIIKNFCKKEASKIEMNNNFFIKKLCHIYKKNFKINNVAKNKYLIFIAFHIIKNNINLNINLFQQEHLIIQSNANINRMYGNIINTLTSNLSYESKNIMIKNYNKIYNEKMNKSEQIINPKQISDTTIDINIVELTNYPEYVELKRNNQNQNQNYNEINQKEEFQEKKSKETLISKNMNLNDIKQRIEDKKYKKLDILTQLVTYKKKVEEPKTVIDFYVKDNEENDKETERDKEKTIETKSIKYNKR